MLGRKKTFKKCWFKRMFIFETTYSTINLQMLFDSFFTAREFTKQNGFSLKKNSYTA